ncbi:MAG: lipoprotein signal peptidase [Spirulina sp. SIO3F2]|nr:lipoprotein signal peptidase [Spirulina sp. SIO3F2]
MRYALLKNRWFWMTALTALVLDQITKYWIRTSFDLLGETVPIVPGVFHFTYVINTGAAFSLFAGGVEWLRWLSLLVSIGLMIYALISPRWILLEQIGFGFILSGALGNGICRFLYSHVIDFLDFRLINFPVFNLADVFINIGIACLLYLAFRPQPVQP